MKADWLIVDNFIHMLFITYMVALAPALKFKINEKQHKLFVTSTDVPTWPSRKCSLFRTA